MNITVIAAFRYIHHLLFGKGEIKMKTVAIHLATELESKSNEMSLTCKLAGVVPLVDSDRRWQQISLSITRECLLNV